MTSSVEIALTVVNFAQFEFKYSRESLLATKKLIQIKYTVVKKGKNRKEKIEYIREKITGKSYVCASA